MLIHSTVRANKLIENQHITFFHTDILKGGGGPILEIDHEVNFSVEAKIDRKPTIDLSVRLQLFLSRFFLYFL